MTTHICKRANPNEAAICAGNGCGVCKDPVAAGDPALGRGSYGKTIPLSRYVEAWRLANLVSLNLRADPDFGTDEWKNRRDNVCAEAMKKYLEG